MVVYKITHPMVVFKIIHAMVFFKIIHPMVVLFGALKMVKLWWLLSPPAGCGTYGNPHIHKLHSRFLNNFGTFGFLKFLQIIVAPFKVAVTVLQLCPVSLPAPYYWSVIPIFKSSWKLPFQTGHPVPKPSSTRTFRADQFSSNYHFSYFIDFRETGNCFICCPFGFHIRVRFFVTDI